MVAAMAHRGPDGAGIAACGAAAIGAVRLAIRGLHDGRQPIADGALGVVVACNGEIDNHRELRAWLVEQGYQVSAATDIAVLPAMYRALGDSFIDRLVGAFAIALWDQRDQRLLLARDRAGERHLFYAVGNGEARFATELGALGADPCRPLGLDTAAVSGFLRDGYFVAPSSPATGVRKVAPGEIVTLGIDGVSARRYWRWPVTAAARTVPSVDRFDEVFREAVRRQSDVDVPYGVFLSGGIDSSLVAAVARSVRPDHAFKAFTVRFEEASYDEGSHAERVADALGVPCVPVWVAPAMLPAALADLVRRVGEPLADPAWVPAALLARRASEDVKLALIGEGADELFGGYPTYIGARVSAGYARLPAALQSVFARAVRRWPPSDRKVTVSFLLKKFVDGAALDGVARHLLWTSNISPALLQRLGVQAPAGRATEPAGELLDTLQLTDLETSLAEGLLVKGDRSAMASALELRAPFLDRDVMEFAATLPACERVRGLTTKVFLKRFAARYLPRAIVHRRKRGLSVPLSRWLRDPLADWAIERIGAESLALAGVDRRAALDLFDEHRSRRADHARPLWALIVLSEWLESRSQKRRDLGQHARGLLSMRDVPAPLEDHGPGRAAR
jgi:asparagine synthase (glutamine-hydrolysing)